MREGEVLYTTNTICTYYYNSKMNQTQHIIKPTISATLRTTEYFGHRPP